MEESFRIRWSQVMDDVAGERPDFPKYTTQLINLANQNAQGTRPATVGKMSELIQKCPHKSYEGWRAWYLEQKPGAIDEAVARITPMLRNFGEALSKIDDAMVRAWVEDLVLTKTAEGLILQEAILREVAERHGENWRLADAGEESRNIDGYIGGQPVSIKPVSYDSKRSTVRENIGVPVIRYERTPTYLKVYSPL